MAEIASAFVSLLPSAKGFGSKVDSQIGPDLEKSGKRQGGRFGKVFATASISPIRAFGAAAIGLFAADKAKDFMKDIIGEASDLNEAGTKTTAIFGKAGTTMVNQFAARGAKSLGQTKLQVLDAAATFGTFGKAAGKTGPELAKFSTGLVGLSTDLASFFNTSPDQAAEAIAAGLRGESEPLRQYGVLLDDATLRQEALRQGLVKTTKQALTPQQKVLAAQAVIMKQTKDAQGDFARTSGGLANQQRILAAQFGNLKGQLGKGLLPVAVKVVSFFNSLLPKISALGPVVSQVGGYVSKFFAGFSSGGAGSGLVSTFKSVAAAIQANFLPVLRTMATTLTTVVLPAILRLASYLQANLFPIFRQVASIIATQVVPIVASLARFFYGTLVPAVVRVATSVATALKPVLDQLFRTIQTSVLPTVQRLLAKFREWRPTIQKVISVVVAITGKILVFAATVLGKVLPPLIRFAGFMLRNVVGGIIAVITVLAKIVGAFIRVGTAVVNGIKAFARFSSAVDEKVRAALRVVAAIPGKVASALGNLGHLLFNAGAAIIQGLINGITSRISALTSKLHAITSLIPKHKGPLEKDRKLLHPAGKAIMDGLIKGLKSKEGALKDALSAITDKLRDSQQAATDFAAGIADKFRGDLFTGGLTEFNAQLNVDTTSARSFTAALSSAVGKGLDGGLYQAVAASGSVRVAQDLANLNRAQIAAEEAAFNIRENAVKAAGQTPSDRIYGDTIQAQLVEMRGIRADLKQVTNRLNAAEHKRQIIVNDKSGSPKKTAKEVSRQLAHKGGG